MDARKRRRIVTAAAEYLQRNPCDLQPRLDLFEVITLSKDSDEILSFHYLKNAFDARDYNGFI